MPAMVPGREERVKPAGAPQQAPKKTTAATERWQDSQDGQLDETIQVVQLHRTWHISKNHCIRSRSRCDL
jgi:hypothetical protein